MLGLVLGLGPRLGTSYSEREGNIALFGSLIHLPLLEALATASSCTSLCSSLREGRRRGGGGEEEGREERREEGGEEGREERREEGGEGEEEMKEGREEIDRWGRRWERDKSRVLKGK